MRYLKNVRIIGTGVGAVERSLLLMERNVNGLGRVSYSSIYSAISLSWQLRILHNWSKV